MPCAMRWAEKSALPAGRACAHTVPQICCKRPRMGALAQIADDYEIRLPWNLTPAQSWFTKGPSKQACRSLCNSTPCP
uniref:Uncharacterized protein n=1 Tax=Ralstonia solanacearum TaxID=305 RepID=A0A0S4WH11_RALSL|nr:protein of unknown function [Ralstonia solanacearum]